MARVQFRLDQAGVRELLKSGQFSEMIEEKAKEVAGNLRAEGHTAETRSLVSDRNVAQVRLRDGMKLQAKDGALTRAAAAAGLKLHRPKRRKK